MLKRKILAAVLPVVAASTIVGAGFSAWHFGDTTTNVDGIGVGISVTDPATGVGSFTVTLNNSVQYDNHQIRVVLDQGTKNNRADNTKGISFEYNTGSAWENLTSITFGYEIDKKTYDNLNAAHMDLTLTFSVVFKKGFCEWVSPKGSTLSSDASYEWSTLSLTKGTDGEGNTTFTHSPESLTGATSGSYKLEWKLDTSTTSEENKMLEYVKKPNAFSDNKEQADEGDLNVYYDDLKAAMEKLGGTAFTLSASASLSEL